MTEKKILNELTGRYPVLEPQREAIYSAYRLTRESFAAGGKLLLCGNGGSAADCEHIVGELMKSFRIRNRPADAAYLAALRAFGEEGGFLSERLEGALPAVSLCGHTAFSTAFANDKEGVLTFAQLINGWGRAGDVLWTLSTSGSSANCVYAAIAARARGMKVVSLTGEGGGKLGDVSDAVIAVPEHETFKVQELHLPVYHCLCAMLENAFFNAE